MLTYYYADSVYSSNTCTLSKWNKRGMQKYSENALPKYNVNVNISISLIHNLLFSQHGEPIHSSFHIHTTPCLPLEVYEKNGKIFCLLQISTISKLQRTGCFAMSHLVEKRMTLLYWQPHVKMWGIGENTLNPCLFYTSPPSLSWTVDFKSSRMVPISIKKA